MAKFDQPSAGTTAMISGLLFLIVLSALQLSAQKLASTPQLTIVGGFVSSLLFVFALLCIGNLERETKWVEVIVCVLVAMAAAATVHRVCITTCFLFSAAELFYMNFVSQRINKVPVTTPTLKRVRSSDKMN